MTRRPTVYDVAQRAGVSIATVSFAFSQPQRVKASTLETVLEAARVLGYLPSGSARGLARGRTGAIGLYSFDYLLPDGEADSPPDDGHRTFPLYVDEVQNGVERECRRLGYALMAGGARPTPSMPAIVDVAGRVDGLIAFAGTMSPDLVDSVARRIPVIALGTAVDGPRVRTVPVDNTGGMRRVTEHLVTGHGCRRFVYLGAAASVEFSDRYAGFAGVLTAAGITPPPMTPSAPGVDHSTEEIVRTAVEHGLPDAFVCSTDQEALVTLDLLAAAGIDVPGRVLVTGFDGIVAGRLSAPTLTTVRQPMEQIGRVAVRTLVALLDDDGDAAPPAVLPTELVLRGSCGCHS